MEKPRTRTPRRVEGRPTWTLVAVGLSILGAAVLSSPAGAQPNPREESRYPYDPVCAWGRLADGNGMLVRCLGASEAALLLKGVSPTPPTAPPAPSTTSTAAPAPPEPEAVEAKVTSVSADEGSFPTGVKSLSKANERYAECAQKHGGLAAPKAEVHVRFLVRARGRAEGVSVKKKTGVSAQAAKCIADVVDRRYVGLPAGPLVGGVAVIALSKVKKQ